MELLNSELLNALWRCFDESGGRQRKHNRIDFECLINNSTQIDSFSTASRSVCLCHAAQIIP